MSYQIRFTDTTNLDKTPITVEDSTIDSSTDISFPGRNVTGYGTSIAENFLHILENFASSVAPERPIEGQLWYDVTPGINQLKVYDGTSWSAAGGLKKGGVEPDLATSLPGDLWTNTDTQQLYLFSGSGWILVGPRFSSGARTGAEPEFIDDTLSNAQAVVSNYVNGERVAIISSTEFTPKTLIPGFTIIKQGVNLNTNYNTYFGVAEKASALLVGSATVAASNFLRSDITSNTNFAINIKNSAGVSVGEDSQLNLGISAGTGVIFHKTSGSTLDIRMNNNGSIRTVLSVDSAERVGINNTNPQTALDVTGDITTSGSLFSNSATQSTTTLTGSGVFAGGVGIVKNVNIGGNISVGGTSTFTGTLLPLTNNGANIGSADFKFNRIFAARVDSDLYGNVYGTLTGNTTGSSTKLASPTIFDLAGDITSNEVQFDGQTGTPTLNTITSTGNGIEATLTFAAQLVAPYPTGSTIVVSSIAPVSYRGTYVVTDGGLDYVKFANTTVGSQTSTGAISRSGQAGNRKRFFTQLSESFIEDKPLVESVEENDQFVISRGAEGLKSITKASIFNAIPQTPAGVMLPYGGLAAPTGWLLCDGSEVLVSEYPTLFDAIRYTFGDIVTLSGLGTFKLPDMRGRMALGADNMNNGVTVPSKLDPTDLIATGGGSADRVTDPEADNIGLANGAESAIVTEDQIPDHVHDMTGEDDNQYYAFRNVPGDPTDADAISGQGSDLTARGQYMSNSGGIFGYTDQRALNIMNPYLAVNYIIYTGN